MISWFPCWIIKNILHHIHSEIHRIGSLSQKKAHNLEETIKEREVDCTTFLFQIKAESLGLGDGEGLSCMLFDLSNKKIDIQPFVSRRISSLLVRRIFISSATVCHSSEMRSYSSLKLEENLSWNRSHLLKDDSCKDRCVSRTVIYSTRGTRSLVNPDLCCYENLTC
ncbi:hypothetical protein Tco_0767039 [Tanacetum coccineum]